MDRWWAVILHRISKIVFVHAANHNNFDHNRQDDTYNYTTRIGWLVVVAGPCVERAPFF
ncbi:hypothetical protein PF004_g29900 [Phytophthora fragariae]|uniref:Uncharacterized protein n=1 Tax=Phytophthora fragariae TaxID=53985 RepID=A0A6G0ME68_9STRA|nr:hypothetical protein PF004_g29900 [Phytophthora fragariae]